MKNWETSNGSKNNNVFYVFVYLPCFIARKKYLIRVATYSQRKKEIWRDFIRSLPPESPNVPDTVANFYALFVTTIDLRRNYNIPDESRVPNNKSCHEWKNYFLFGSSC